MTKKEDFLPSAEALTLFSTTWCGYCRRLKQQLSDITIREVNIEEDESAAALIQEINGGNQTVPVVLFSDGIAMTNPSAADVKKKCGELAGEKP